MSQTAYPHLWQMFGAYFHQDWDTEEDDWPDLVRNFAQGQPTAELEDTGTEIDRLIADSPDDGSAGMPARRHGIQSSMVPSGRKRRRQTRNRSLF